MPEKAHRAAVAVSGLRFRWVRVILGAGYSTLQFGDTYLPLIGQLFLERIALPVVSPLQSAG